MKNVFQFLPTIVVIRFGFLLFYRAFGFDLFSLINFKFGLFWKCSVCYDDALCGFGFDCFAFGDSVFDGFVSKNEWILAEVENVFLE